MLIDVINDIRARFTAQGITTEILVGKRHLKPHTRTDGTAGDRIVVIPNDDAYDGPQDFNSSFNPHQNANPRARLTRSAGAEVHIWGVPADPTSATADDEAVRNTEIALHNFAREFRQVTRGHRRSLSGRWNNEVWDLVYGAEYILQVSVDIPVVDLAKTPLPVGSSITTTPILGNTSETG